jgi:hypothetical protein
MLALQLTPSALRLLSPKKLKTPVSLALLPIGQAMGQGKEQAVEPAKGGRRARAGPGPGTATTAKPGTAKPGTAKPGTGTATTAKPGTATTAGLKGRIVRVAVTDGTGQAQKQEEQVIQTRSGRRSVKRVIFEAGKNKTTAI